MPEMYVMFKPGSVMLCTKEINFGSAVIPEGTTGIVETVSLDNGGGRHYTVYFALVLMDGDREEEEVPYIPTEERMGHLGIRMIQTP
ncbi:hypothetical protein JL_191 [Bacillus phage JL]|uniref:DUF4926 domain-containing protein n=1 Tax=Bacillus phage JL TaxID=1296655 RepID=S5M8L3_9CAUD|nr:hypothetical protein AVV47_gp105 [Bacillus phage JL]AGR46858.1 hypothetical protein JL_191 [Bacillus phage JL]